MLNRAHLLQSCVSASCWVLYGVTAVMSHFLHTDSNCLVSFYLISRDSGRKRFSERGVFTLSVIFLVSLQPPAASEPDQTPPAELLNTAPLNATTSLSLLLQLFIPPASCRLLGEILNSGTLAVVILLRSSSLLFHFSFPFLNSFHFPSPSSTSRPDWWFLFCPFRKTSVASCYSTADRYEVGELWHATQTPWLGIKTRTLLWFCYWLKG